MEKLAPTDLPVHDLIRRRWSPYAFSERPVEPAVLQTILEAARWTPSCFNEQPWRFVVATRDDEEGYERLLGCLMEGNKGWARRAPVLILAVAKEQFTHNGKENRFALYDTGAAVMSLCLQATALGLFCHQMGGFDGEKARAELGVPEGFTPAAMLALGYPGDPEELPEPLRERQDAPRRRKALSEIVFRGRWEEPGGEGSA
jgi:nitroreductase